MNLHFSLSDKRRFESIEDNKSIKMKDQVMKVSDRTRSGGRVLARCLLGSCLAILAGLTALQAQASIVEITAAFSPDPNNPQVNTFQNTTPNSGLCATFPYICSPQGLFSISLGFEALTQYPIPANHANTRDGAMIKVPAEDRTVMVTSTTGDTAEVKFTITAFSATNRTVSIPLITGIPRSSGQLAQRDLWGTRWGEAAGLPCIRGTNVTTDSVSDADYFWLTPDSAACGKSPLFEIPWLRMRNSSGAYLMTTPDPLKMESGIYRGSITYTVGPGGDFDFGDNLVATDNIVTMNFTLSVEHTLKFQFPAGYGSVVLNPAGGWQQWLNNGRRPQKLTADQGFKMWASTQFSIGLQCEYAVGDQCAIKNPAGDAVPVETRVTLPYGLRDASNQAVSRLLLSTNPQVFTPGHYVDNRPAALHFEVARDQVKSMIDDHSGSTYKGNITVVWNSEV